MRYNERIRAIREDNSLTQQKIAELLHIGQRTYSDYESGKTRIPVDSLLILAQFYNVSMDYITGASSVKNEFPIITTGLAGGLLTPYKGLLPALESKDSSNNSPAATSFT